MRDFYSKKLQQGVCQFEWKIISENEVMIFYLIKPLTKWLFQNYSYSIEYRYTTQSAKNHISDL